MNVELNFAQPGEGDAKLEFEYSADDGWRLLGGPQQRNDHTSHFTKNGSITFRCPAEWRERQVNAEANYWLRVRINTGDYGKPLSLTAIEREDGSYVIEPTGGNLKPPLVQSITLSYTYTTGSILLDHCVGSNLFVEADYSDDCRWTRRPFSPFQPLPDRQSAFYLGFSAPLPPGLVSLYARVTEDATQWSGASPLVWEYSTAEGWVELGLLDETRGFRQSGMIQFVGPADAVATSGPGGMLHRVRARLKPGEKPPQAVLEGLWLNAAWANQGESLENETVGSTDGTPGQVLHFAPQRVPVLTGETIEIREWSGRGDDWRTAVGDVAEADRRIEKDPATGTPIAVWVRWKGRPHLYESEAADRHYTLERVRGLLAFGDGRYGRIPPAGCPVRASYTTGVGLAGNVPAGTITELRTGAAYLGSVNNPFPAVGGGDTEPLAAVGQRGPQRVRHRDRAVAAADYEWLAREASPAVARARCLALLAPQGRKVRGATSLVIVPRSTERFPQPDAGLLRRVREHLQPRMPACAASALQLFGPAYVAVTVHAHVVPLRAGDAATVEAALRRGIDAYLHPLSGGAEGNGWDFGQPVNLSAIALLVETTPGVDYAIEISLHAGDERVGDRVEVPPDALVAAGRHQLKISVGIE